MKSTYKAMQIARPGELDLVERRIPEPGIGEVLNTSSARHVTVATRK